MLRTYTDGVLTVTKDDNSTLVLSTHPERQDAWLDENEALTYFIDDKYHFIKPEDITHTKVSPIEFKLLFTSQERIAIKQARNSDPIIEDFFDIVEDPRLESVDLSLNSTYEGIGYMATLGLIQPERVDEIIQGVIK